MKIDTPEREAGRESKASRIHAGKEDNGLNVRSSSSSSNTPGGKKASETCLIIQ